jgi:hypothetical protein
MVAITLDESTQINKLKFNRVINKNIGIRDLNHIQKHCPSSYTPL